MVKPEESSVEKDQNGRKALMENTISSINLHGTVERSHVYHTAVSCSTGNNGTFYTFSCVHKIRPTSNFYNSLLFQLYVERLKC